MEAFKHLMIGKSPGPTEAYAEMILAIGDVRIMELLESLFDLLVEGTLPEYTKWKRNASRLGYQS